MAAILKIWVGDRHKEVSLDLFPSFFFLNLFIVRRGIASC